MMVYLGQTRSAKLISLLSWWGFGECTNRGESLPPKRRPWFADNGAYKDWTSGKTFDAKAYMAHLRQLDEHKPDFVVVPDKVASADSLAFSLLWLPVVRRFTSAPAYLAVQNGMQASDLIQCIGRFDGIFVGGDNQWKIATGEQWVAFAHLHGMPCHIGRAGTDRKAAWAKRIGADSIDSCFPLWWTSADPESNLTQFLVGLGLYPSPQMEIFR